LSVSFIETAQAVHEIPWLTTYVRTNERTNAADGQPENITPSPSPTMSGGEDIKISKQTGQEPTISLTMALVTSVVYGKRRTRVYRSK